MTTLHEPKKFTFVNGANAQFINGLYADFLKNPESVDPSWRQFFEGYEFASAYSPGPIAGVGNANEARVEAFINLYRRLGHFSAHLDPLSPEQPLHSDMEPEVHGLAGVDPEEKFHPSNLPFSGPMAFKEIFALLRDTYCRNVGADFREVNSVEAAVWLQTQMETVRNRPAIEKEAKLRILDKLVRAEGLERFLQDRFLGQKRFSVEGLDAVIPLMDALADEATKDSVDEIGLGMAHRGRLNTLVNFMGKPAELMFKEFEDSDYNTFDIDGDVKYHKGFAGNIQTLSGKSIRAYLAPNPSHLEAVNPVVEGFVRARQRLLNDASRKKVLPILMHGDASFIGQGLVTETLNFSELDAYTTGGTIHIITNNQVGFTTNPDESRSCSYSSDVAKVIRAPVFHVNADDPEAVVWVAKLAFAYRQKFQRDVVIDLVGYRRHGHNETDEPGFTQPEMYKVIKNHPTVLKLYSQQLVNEGVISSDAADAKVRDFRASLQEGLDRVRKGNLEILTTNPKELEGSLKLVKATREDMFTKVKTAVAAKTVQDLTAKITSVPANFTPHPKIVKLLQGRARMLDGEGSIDWGMAELLAYASLAQEGRHVRLTGQDCRRGTFSHRHAVLVDFEDSKRCHLLNQLGPKQGVVDIVNSPLSEQGCLGFEFGYSVADRDALVLWEAQFGDFANGAQIIIDQFIAASEAKWKQASGLVMLLPHGYEGMGPEHSSARPERFLQLCGNLNMQVANLTTPAQLFHILRRQVVRDFRKPLIVMSPKSLLRHPKVISQTKELTQGSFVEVLDDAAIKNAKAVERIIFCTGKIYYELDKAREEMKDGQDTAIVRIEQLYPFPTEDVKAILKKYSAAKKVFWVQEEPMNMGAWTFLRHRLEEILNTRATLEYVGRKNAGTPAEGSHSSHHHEQERIIAAALGITRTVESKKESKKL